MRFSHRVLGGIVVAALVAVASTASGTHASGSTSAVASNIDFTRSFPVRVNRSADRYDQPLAKEETSHPQRTPATIPVVAAPVVSPPASVRPPVARKVTKATVPAPATTVHPGGGWAALRQCENGGSYGRSTSPIFFGAYQFDHGTWAANGGDPSHWGSASPEEQDRVAQTLYSRRGAQPWPVCGRYLR